MKRFTLSAVAVMASAMSFAQTTLWNGENYELGTTGGAWDRCTPVVVENPDKSGVNTSDKCMKITVTGTGWDNGDLALPIREWMPEGVSFASKRLSVMIKKEGASNVKIELSDPTDGSEGYWKHVAAWYDGGENNEWRKVYFDFSQNGEFDHPGVLCVYPTTDAVDGALTVYIDNIQIEDVPTVNGVALSEVEDASLTGALKLQGAWLKGDCSNLDADWAKVEYDDFALLQTKLTNGVTSVDMRGTTLKDADVDRFYVNPNTIVYADNASEHVNLVADGVAQSVSLNGAYAFAVPEAFSALNTKLTRTAVAGVNAFVLPFGVTATEVAAERLAVCSKVADGVVEFTKVDEVEANVPFITVGAEVDGEEKAYEFADKTFAVTPETFEGEFKGSFAPRAGEGCYVVDGEGNLVLGTADLGVKAFDAYLQLAEGVTAAEKITFAEEITDGINGVETVSTGDTAVYSIGGVRVAKSLESANLQRGVYVVAGKKVVIK